MPRRARRPHPDAERVTRDKRQQVARGSADAAIAALAARQWGVVSVRDLRLAGLTDDAIATRVRRQGLHPLHRGAYAVGHPNPPVEGRFLAAVMACGPGAVLSHFAAAALWGFVEGDRRLPEVTVEGARAPAHPSIRTHRTCVLDPALDLRTRYGIPVTSPARTIIDLAVTLSPAELRSAVRRAQALGLVRLEELLEMLTRFRRRAGSRKLARIVATGPAPTRSVLEDVVLDLILGGGFEHPAVNEPLVLDGRTVIPDFRWARQRVVVEADGAAWHDHRLAREADAERQALLEASGERVLRVTWEQAVARPAETLARLRAAGVPPAG